MRRLTKTFISLGMITVWGCSDSDGTNDVASAGSAGIAGIAGQTAATAGSSSTAGGSANSGGSSSTAGTGASATAGSTSAGTGGDASGGDGGAAGAAVGSAGSASGGTAGSTSTAGTGGTGGDGTSTGAGSGGTGGASAGAGGAAAASAPAAPSAVVVDTTSSAFAVNLSWMDNSDNETGFDVYLSSNDTMPATATATVDANVTAYTLTQVLGGTTYRAWIVAKNDAGASSASETTASAATADLTWDSLWYDETGSVHLAVEDSYNLLTDGDDATGLYAYHSADSSNKGSALELDAGIVIDVANANIDITAVHYFWAEARTAAGSLFSLRQLAPAGSVQNLVATQDGAGLDLTWDPTASATGYELSYGTSDDLTVALSAGASTITSATLSPLAADTAYWVWVRATSAGIGGNGFPGPYASVPAQTSE